MRDRPLTKSETLEVIRRGEFGALCMNIPNGLPYGIQISYALDEEANVLYFHETIRDG